MPQYSTPHQKRKRKITYGELRGRVLRKTVYRSRHFLRTPPAIAIDYLTFCAAREAGGEEAEITDCESGDVYRASFALIAEKGLVFNRGWGEQIALALTYWRKNDNG